MPILIRDQCLLYFQIGLQICIEDQIILNLDAAPTLSDRIRQANLISKIQLSEEIYIRHVNLGNIDLIYSQIHRNFSQMQKVERFRLFLANGCPILGYDFSDLPKSLMGKHQIQIVNCKMVEPQHFTDMILNNSLQQIQVYFN